MTELSGVKRAAIFLLALGPEASKGVIQKLSPSELEQVMVELARMDPVPADLVDEVLVQASSQLNIGSFTVTGGSQVAREYLELAFPENFSDIMGNIDRRKREEPFSYLIETDPKAIAAALLGEHPQTIALVLSYSTPAITGAVLEALRNRNLAVDVGTRLSMLGHRDEDVVKAIEDRLKPRFGNIKERSGSGEFEGKEHLVQSLFAASNKVFEEDLIKHLREVAPTIAEEIQEKMFRFEDLDMLSQEDLGRVITRVRARGVDEVSLDELAMAMKLAPISLKDKLLAMIPGEESKEAVLEALELKYPLVKAEAARNKMVRIARKMHENQEITVRRGEQLKEEEI